MKILADASLPNLEQWFPPPFTLTYYHTAAQVPDRLPGINILLCRSTLPITKALLEKSSLTCIATASSGSDHIDDLYLQQQGITLFDAKGCNATAVADYVIMVIAALTQQGIDCGTRAAIVGVGEVGSRVHERLIALDFQVVLIDPLRARIDPSFHSQSERELKACHLICIHANLHANEPFPSHNLFDEPLLSQLKPRTILINASRGGIVNEKALINNANPLIYCTDVYSNEPNINPNTLQYATLCTPHIAGHSIEGKANAVELLSHKIHQHYGLTPPVLTQHEKQIPLTAAATWQQTVLNCYNPWQDTLALKNALNGKDCFLKQRQAHTFRHDLVHYKLEPNDPKTQLILGRVTQSK